MNGKKIAVNGKQVLERVMNGVFFLCGVIAIAFVILITVYMLISGIPAISKVGLFEFLFGQEWKPSFSEPKFGILPLILSSVYATAGATLLGVPIGLMMAVFLSKVASKTSGLCCTARGGTFGGNPQRGIRFGGRYAAGPLCGRGV